jgi:hypothetical protein
MAKKPTKSMGDTEEDDSSSAEDSEEEMEIEVSISKPKKSGTKKMAKGGVVKNFSRIARPQKFAGTF